MEKDVENDQALAENKMKILVLVAVAKADSEDLSFFIWLKPFFFLVAIH